MLNEVGATLSKGAAIIAELRFLRIIEFHWNFDVGDKLALGNLVL
jgi:hypothetical protein